MKAVTNYVEPIPGSTVVAYLGYFGRPESARFGTWSYSLWNDSDEAIAADLDDLIAAGDFPPGTFPEEVTPNQVARIAFLLEVEYKRS